MIDGPFRQILPRYVRPLLDLYEWLGLRPNHVTIAGFAFALAAAFGTSQGLTVLPLGLWWLGRLLDGTDGIYARASNQTSDFGGYLDIMLDMASYSVMILGFAYHSPQLNFYWLIILFLYVLCITSALSMGALTERSGLGPSDNRSLTLAAGLAEGGETGAAYTLFLLFPSWIPVLVPVWIAILATTVIARSTLAWQLLGSTKESSLDTERD
jgi:phosphatidylglycerophosphate synthase